MLFESYHQCPGETELDHHGDHGEMKMGPADTVQESCWERLGENQQRDLLPCFYGCVQCAVSPKCHSNPQVGVEMGARAGDFSLALRHKRLDTWSQGLGKWL